MVSSSHAAELGMYAAQRHRVSGPRIGLTVGHDLINQVADFGSRERVAGTIAQATQGLSCNIAYIRIRQNDEKLQSSMPFRQIGFHHSHVKALV